MTKEEYLLMTSYASPEDANEDLKTIQFLFPLILVLFMCARTVIQIGWMHNRSLGMIALAATGIVLAYFIWTCWSIAKKTRKVTKAEPLFSLVLAPLSWIWFYPQLSEPLEIIVGKRMPPTTDVAAEAQARIDASKKGTRNAIRTILIVIGIGLVVAVAMNASK